MVFNTGAALLDAVVLAVVSREQEGTYGYKITQDVREVLEVSESTRDIIKLMISLLGYVSVFVAVVLGLLNEKMSNKKKTQVTNSVKRPVDPISTELGISCMSISAENNTRIEKEERQ